MNVARFATWPPTGPLVRSFMGRNPGQRAAGMASGRSIVRVWSARLRRLRSLHSLAVPLEDHEGEGRAAGVGDPVHHPGGGVDRVALGGGKLLAVEVPAAGALGHEEKLLVGVLVRGMDLLAGLEHHG